MRNKIELSGKAKVEKLKFLPKLANLFVLSGLLLGTVLAVWPIQPAFAAAGISPSGGGKFVTGQSFTISVKASGATFDSLQGTISVSGVASIVSFSAGSATWLPGKSPSNGSQFVGIVSPTSSLTVATITLRSTKEGSGSVSVSGVRLARSGGEVGTGGGSTSYSVSRAPTPPGGLEVSSSTHPDQNESYGASTVLLEWKAPSNGADGYSTLLNQEAETVPTDVITTKDLTATYDKLTLGTHYFHIRAHNGDGWGGATHFKINVKEAVDATLAAPAILSVEKTELFKNDVEKGTVTGFKISGSSTGLTGFTGMLVFTPTDKLPVEQKLEFTPSETDGTWSVDFDQAIPTGFYSIVTRAKKEQSITPDSLPLFIEVSVANGGTAKIITADDLPKPNLTVTVAGVTFSTSRHLWAALAIVLFFAFLVTLIAYVARQFYKKYRSKKQKIAPAIPLQDSTPKKRL